MTWNTRELLRQIGQGTRWETLAARYECSTGDLEAWFVRECRARVPAAEGHHQVARLGRNLTIVRDALGVPHIDASSDEDAFFGFGFAVAQDRLFQLDYLRRKARGRLAELLGPEAIESDRLYRTLDLASVAQAEWERMPSETRKLVASYADGVNGAIEASYERWPIEFDLLDARPVPWSPLDSLLIVGEFRWYLTGRFPVIVIPELVKRAVGVGPLYEAFLQGEENDECILPAGSYPRRGAGAPGAASGGGAGDSFGGSNNWVVGAERCAGPGPLVASDPHVPFQAVSIWHQVHVRGGRFNFAGISLAGMPGVMMGRNERVAWAVTNNISSLRDLYQEERHPERYDTYRVAEGWKPATIRVETISVRGGEPVELRVATTDNGPLVDELLPPVARGLGPVSLRWVGHEPCGWIAAVIGMNGSRDVAECRESMRPWLAPTFNMVFADVTGRIGYQCTGGIPLRQRVERGFRRGWDPGDTWQGRIPFDELPRLDDPASRAIVTANNPVAPPDFQHPLSGTWVSGYRARRIRRAIESQPKLTRDDHRRQQLDVYSARAARCVPALLAALEASPAEPFEGPAQDAIAELRGWDFEMCVDASGASIFHLFFLHWCREVTARRLPPEQVEFVSANAGGLAVELLERDPWNWFDADERIPAIRRAFRAAVEELAQRLGRTPNGWQWGRLHTLVQPHYLSSRGVLGRWFDRHGRPVGGDANTVNSSSPNANHAAWLGAGYRLLAELGDPECGLWSVELGSVSGHPGSPHYDDQADAWHAGELCYSSLKTMPAGPTLTLTPRE